MVLNTCNYLKYSRTYYYIKKKAYKSILHHVFQDRYKKKCPITIIFLHWSYQIAISHLVTCIIIKSCQIRYFIEMQQILIPLHIHICTVFAEMLQNTRWNNLLLVNKILYRNAKDNHPLTYPCMYSTCRNIAEQKVKQPAFSQWNLIYCILMKNSSVLRWQSGVAKHVVQWQIL